MKKKKRMFTDLKKNKISEDTIKNNKKLGDYDDKNNPAND